MLIDRGSGVPIVLVPGLQGRWEYMANAVDALSASFRVITFSLCDEPQSGFSFQPDAGFDSYVEQIERVLDVLHIDRAVICGVSFGGRIALAFAARRPERTRALILVSTPGPGWHLKIAHARYVRRPLLAAPLFFAGAPGRLRRELAAALPGMADRCRFAFGQLRALLRAGLSPARMAARAILMQASSVEGDCVAVRSPALVITGEPTLDHVVPVDGTSGFVRLLGGARHVVLERTGHLGSITRPDVFADVIAAFVRAAA